MCQTKAMHVCMHKQWGGPTYHQLAVNTNWSTQEHANLTLILPCAKGCNSYPQKHLSSLAYLQTTQTWNPHSNPG